MTKATVASGVVEDFVGLRDDVDGGAELQSAGVVDGESGGAVIDDEDGFIVFSDASLRRARNRFCARPMIAREAQSMARSWSDPEDVVKTRS